MYLAVGQCPKSLLGETLHKRGNLPMDTAPIKRMISSGGGERNHVKCQEYPWVYMSALHLSSSLSPSFLSSPGHGEVKHVILVVSLDWPARLRIAAKVADGMAFSTTPCSIGGGDDDDANANWSFSSFYERRRHHCPRQPQGLQHRLHGHHGALHQPVGPVRRHRAAIVVGAILRRRCCSPEFCLRHCSVSDYTLTIQLPISDTEVRVEGRIKVNP